MKIIRFFVVSMLLFSAVGAYCQGFDVPIDYQLNTKEDYKTYEKDIIAAATWLTTSPLNEHLANRKDVAAFVVKWVNGSPTVNCELNEVIFDFEKKNPGMLVIYMANSAKYVLENNYSKDMRAKHRFALRAMISVYKSDKGIKRDKKMERLIKSDEDGKIDEWLSENLKIEGQK